MGGLSDTQIIFISLLQTIVILCFFLGFSLFKINKLKKQSISNTSPQAADETQGDSRVAYLMSELETTSLQLKYFEENASSTDVSGLTLRQNLLKFELAHLEASKQNEGNKADINWADQNLKLYKMVKASGFIRDVEKSSAEAGGEDTAPPPSESLLEQQNKTIEHLKKLVDELLAKAGKGEKDGKDEDEEDKPSNNELNSHFTKLENANKELEQCVLILEDENSFLRDQIASLLKLEPDE